jgi:hypothetical protein
VKRRGAIAITAINVAILLAAVGFGNVGRAAAAKIQSVLVANGPAHPVAVAGTVRINPAANTVRVAGLSTSPVWVRDVNAGGQPFQTQVTVSLPAGAAGAGGSFPSPLSKRLVIETVSAIGQLPPGQHIADAHLVVKTNGVSGNYAIVPVEEGHFPGGSAIDLGVTQTLKVYADTGSTPGFTVYRTDGTGSAELTFEVSGYLVDW